MFQVKGIVPGCFVRYAERDGSSITGRVVLIKNRGFALIQSEDGKAQMCNLNYCTLLNPVIHKMIYDLAGNQVGEISD